MGSSLTCWLWSFLCENVLNWLFYTVQHTTSRNCLCQKERRWNGGKSGSRGAGGRAVGNFSSVHALTKTSGRVLEICRVKDPLVRDLGAARRVAVLQAHERNSNEGFCSWSLHFEECEAENHLETFVYFVGNLAQWFGPETFKNFNCGHFLYSLFIRQDFHNFGLESSIGWVHSNSEYAVACSIVAEGNGRVQTHSRHVGAPPDAVTRSAAPRRQTDAKQQ